MNLVHCFLRYITLALTTTWTEVSNYDIKSINLGILKMMFKHKINISFICFYILLIILLQFSQFSPYIPPVPCTSQPSTIPPLSSCPWVVHISSLTSLFLIPFLISPHLFYAYQFCSWFPLPSPPDSSPHPPHWKPSMWSPFLCFCSCSSCLLSFCFHFFRFSCW